MAIKLQGTNSAAAPGLTNDGGDGVVVGTDTVDISIGGASKVKVDSAGKVGIATTSPGYRIDIGDGSADPPSGYQVRVNSAGDYIVALQRQSTPSFSIRNNSTSIVHLNTQNNKTLALGVSSGNASGSIEEDVKIDSTGDLIISDGDLVIGTSGHGIDFSATSNSSGSMDNELLDDYEKGTWTPTMTGWDTVTPYGGSNYHYGWYVKVGRAVHFGWKIYFQGLSTVSTDPTIKVTGLPFTSGGHVSGPTVNFSFYIPEFGVADNNYWGYMPQSSTLVKAQRNSGGTVVDVDATANRSNVWSMGAGTYMT